MPSPLFERIAGVRPLGVLGLAALLFTWNIWGYDLWAPDEPYFGEGAREMLVDGEWLVPHVNGEITTDKPPLFFWLIAWFSWPTGQVSGLTARLPSVLAGLGTVALTMALVRRRIDLRAAAISGALLAVTYLFWAKARWAQIDSLLCFLIVCALVSFERFRAGEWSGRRAGLLFWGAAALATLAKGPVGLLLPLGIAAATLLVDRQLGRWRQFAPLLGPLLWLAVTLGWAVPASLWGDGYSTLTALEEHFVNRAIHGMHHEQPFWYYIEVLPYALFPWGLLIPGALLLAWRRRAQPLDRFLLTWVTFVVLFFSISTEKRNLYILPAVPAFLVLIARMVDHAGEHGFSRRWVTVPMAVVGGVLVVAALGIGWVLGAVPDSHWWPALGLVVLLAIFGGTVLWSSVRSRPREAVGRAAVLMPVLCLYAVSFLFPPSNPSKSGRALAAAVEQAVADLDPAAARGALQRRDSGTVLGLDIGQVYRQINLHTGGQYVGLVADVGAIAPKLSTDQATVLLVPRRLARDVVAALPSRCVRLLEPGRSGRDDREDIVLLRIEGERTLPAAADSNCLDADTLESTPGTGPGGADNLAEKLLGKLSGD